jgi:hypothetical protein
MEVPLTTRVFYAERALIQAREMSSDRTTGGFRFRVTNTDIFITSVKEAQAHLDKLLLDQRMEQAKEAAKSVAANPAARAFHDIHNSTPTPRMEA